MKSYFVYILKCSDQSYYTGITSNLEKRIIQHNEAKTFDGYTATRRPVDLVWHVVCNDPNDAIKLENRLKGGVEKRKRLS